MATTTMLTVVCPACGQEVELRCRKIEVEVDNGIRIIQTGQEVTLSLQAEAIASGSHSCRVA